EILKDGKEGKNIYVIKEEDYNKLCAVANIEEKLKLKNKNNIAILDENEISSERVWKIGASKIKSVKVNENINMLFGDNEESMNLLEYRG
ncbi:MAG TPA: hypothetical protein DCL31_10420, partial [Clostridium sp.]|nr:hypothetical protein [Clostridium sp.]